MKLDRYKLKAGDKLTTFEFASEGPNGNIVKLIEFSQSEDSNLFNLAFGDKNLQTGELDDFSVSNNGDSNKILATVAAAVYIFTDRFPEAWIYATGSTKARTRLYRMGLAKNFEETKIDFEIWGMFENEWFLFEKEKMYEAFAVKRKFDNFEI